MVQRKNRIFTCPPHPAGPPRPEQTPAAAVFGGERSAAGNRHGDWLVLLTESENGARNRDATKKSPQTLRFAG